jgi:hypothetical protein
LRYNLLTLMILIMSLFVSVGGCSGVLVKPTPQIIYVTVTPGPTPTPIPTPTIIPTPEPTVTPAPTPTPIPVDNIVGLWDTFYNSVYGYFNFFPNETLYYNEGGYGTTGAWSKIDNRHYLINISKGGSKEIILNDKMTRFYINGSSLNFVKI